MLNYNPETVSTDYDISTGFTREISLETVLDLYEYERPDGVRGQHGRPISETISPLRLAKAGCGVLAPATESIDKAEDRAQFSSRSMNWDRFSRSGRK